MVLATRKLSLDGALGHVLKFFGLEKSPFPEGPVQERLMQQYQLRGEPREEMDAAFRGPLVETLADQKGWNMQAAAGSLVIWWSGIPEAERKAHFRCTGLGHGGNAIVPRDIPRLLDKALALRKLFTS